jgi:F0F1-type ATP synthase assembly protein I
LRHWRKSFLTAGSENNLTVGELAMIKSLLEPDEKQPEKIKPEPEAEALKDAAIDENFAAYFADIESPPEAREPENLLEISKPIDDAFIFSEKTEEKPTVQTLAECERTGSELPAGFPYDETNYEPPTETNTEKSSVISSAEISNKTVNSKSPTEVANEAVDYQSPAQTRTAQPKIDNSGLLFQTPAKPESFAETARKSGLAYAAAITLFGSIVFMLIIGWFADLLLGSSPWGIVGGIVFGRGNRLFPIFQNDFANL